MAYLFILRLAIIATTMMLVIPALGQGAAKITIDSLSDKKSESNSGSYVLPARDSLILDVGEHCFKDADGKQVNPNVIRLRLLNVPPDHAVIQAWTYLKMDWEADWKQRTKQYVLNAKTLSPVGIPHMDFAGFKPGEKWEITIGIKAPNSPIDNIYPLWVAKISIR